MQMARRSAEMSWNKVVDESAAYRHESLVIRRAFCRRYMHLAASCEKTCLRCRTSVGAMWYAIWYLQQYFGQHLVMAMLSDMFDRV